MFRCSPIEFRVFRAYSMTYGPRCKRILVRSNLQGGLKRPAWLRAQMDSWMLTSAVEVYA